MVPCAAAAPPSPPGWSRGDPSQDPTPQSGEPSLLEVLPAQAKLRQRHSTRVGEVPTHLQPQHLGICSVCPSGAEVLHPLIRNGERSPWGLGRYPEPDSTAVCGFQLQHICTYWVHTHFPRVCSPDLCVSVVGAHVYMNGFCSKLCWFLHTTEGDLAPFLLSPLG